MLQKQHCIYCNQTKDEHSFKLKRIGQKADGTFAYDREEICNECSKDPFKKNRAKTKEKNKENFNKLSQRGTTELKTRKKKCKQCGRDFKTNNPMDYLCGLKCQFDRKRESRRDHKGRVTYGGPEFIKIKRELKLKQLKERGYYWCMKCGPKMRIHDISKINAHHIVYRSEKPKHKHLNHRKNIYLCCDYHHMEWFHKYKHKARETLIAQRRLTMLFGNDILPMRDINENEQ